MGDGWDFCSTKKKNILTTCQGWVKLIQVYKDSGETLQINWGERGAGKRILQDGSLLLGKQMRWLAYRGGVLKELSSPPSQLETHGHSKDEPWNLPLASVEPVCKPSTAWPVFNHLAPVDGQPSCWQQACLLFLAMLLCTWAMQSSLERDWMALYGCQWAQVWVADGAPQWAHWAKEWDMACITVVNRVVNL